MQIRVGLYGAAIHVLLLVIGLASGFFLKSELQPGLPFAFLLFLAISAFVVYFFIVARYVKKRVNMAKSVLTDSLIGMLSELIIATFAAALTGVYTTVLVFFSEGAAFINIGYNILVFLLWLYGTHLISILVAGNAAGLIGWYLLEKVRVQLPSE